MVEVQRETDEAVYINLGPPSSWALSEQIHEFIFVVRDENLNVTRVELAGKVASELLRVDQEFDGA